MKKKKKTGEEFIMIYLDNASTTKQKPKAVYDALYDFMVNHGANASRGLYGESLKSSEIIVDTQNCVARLFNIENSQNIVFTQNATYALNTAILGTLKKDDHAIVTQIEHNSVLRPINSVCSYTVAKADNTGYVLPKNIKDIINPKTKLIVINHASNVCGTIQDIKGICKIAKENNIKILIDTAQTGGILPVDNSVLDADFIAFSGHKGLMGPMGCGGLYIKNPDEVTPVIYGGTGSESENLDQPSIMPDKFHCGTLNICALAGLCEGINYVTKTGIDKIYEHENELATLLRNELKSIKGVKVYGNDNAIGNVAFNVSGYDSGEVAQELKGFALRAGYHCAPLAHVALGTQNTGAVRASVGVFNTKSDIMALVDAVYKTAK